MKIQRIGPKLSAGVIVYVGDTGNFLLLRKGVLNPKKADGRETHPGSYAPAAYGRLKNGEAPITAATREMGEELGVDFARRVKALNFIGFSADERREVHYYLAVVSSADAETIRVEPHSGGMRAITREEIAGIVGDVGDCKKYHAFPEDPIHMWASALEALKKSVHMLGRAGEILQLVKDSK